MCVIRTHRDRASREDSRRFVESNLDYASIEFERERRVIIFGEQCFEVHHGVSEPVFCRLLEVSKHRTDNNLMVGNPRQRVPYSCFSKPSGAGLVATSKAFCECWRIIAERAFLIVSPLPLTSFDPTPPNREMRFFLYPISRLSWNVRRSCAPFRLFSWPAIQLRIWRSLITEQLDGEEQLIGRLSCLRGPAFATPHLCPFSGARVVRASWW